ncbi:hypothetical protein GCM10027280_51420 [Micromonospora polyrhachis]|uniref:Aromatase n=1 Tax=Micromonospora polyrhachis TaxID=1282883 RepID=A0A7W7SWR8_9ACTN|nr:SRPBCC family protein [Micromonospora polyrhachis]MBB4961976.1 aromatase [Micromonospora polyrhachis]
MTINQEDRLTTADEITTILVRNCGLNAEAAAASPAASLEELGMDSLALLELQAVVADRYRVQIPEDSRELSIAALADVVDRGTGRTATDPEPAGLVGGVQGDPPGHTENSVEIAAPRTLVWELTNDVTRWTSLFTEYQSVDLLEQRGYTVLFRLTMFPDENGISWSWVSQRTMDPTTHEVHAHRVETGPFEYMRIHWRYEELPGGGTRMIWIQDFAMRPTAPVDNAQMTERINTNSRIQLDIIRDKIEKIARDSVVDTPAGAHHD